jgi:hypothetical protein
MSGAGIVRVTGAWFRGELELLRLGVATHPAFARSVALCAAVAVLVVSGTAFASGTWGSSALSTITTEITGMSGPVSVIALAAGGVGLMFGRDFGQLAHVASYVAVVGGMVGLAGTVVGDTGALLP